MSTQEYEFEYACADCKGRFKFSFTALEIKCKIKPVCPNCQSANMIKVFGEMLVTPAAVANFSSGCEPSSGAGCC